MFKEKKFWNNKKILITGHTGFKGSWLSLMLYNFGAKLYGYSLKPKKNDLFIKAKLKKIYQNSVYEDILNQKKFENFLKLVKPDIVFHLAADPLVLNSYSDPKKTFNVNLMGTLNILESVKKVKFPKLVMIVTTDKVYQLKKNNPFYKENDALGASDPYGTSKACVEMLCESYFKSYFKNLKIKMNTLRAGNVIGGGDYSKNRIVPDYLMSLNEKKSLVLRNPTFIRPWQYVLEPLYGYIRLSEKEYKNRSINYSAWNFAPKKNNTVSVDKLIKCFQNSKLNNYKVKLIKAKNKRKVKETHVLKLNSELVEGYLNWRPKYNLEQTVKRILYWNSQVRKNNFFDVSINEVKNYLKKN